MVSHAVLYYTHFVGESVKSELDRLQRELGPEFTLFAMGCCPEKSTLDELANTNVQVRSYVRDELRALPYGRQLENVDWTTLRRNPDLAVMRFFRGNPNFDFYWVVENDVRFSGNWTELFDDLTPSPAELICAHFTSQSQSPKWMHWGTFHSQDDTTDSPNLVRAFLPFSRLSKALMRGIDERCALGWSGHPEVLWPTIALSMGLPIEEIGGSGTLAPEGRRGKYYYSSISREGLFLSTFTAWPFYSAKSDFNHASPPNILWHPVK